MSVPHRALVHLKNEATMFGIMRSPPGAPVATPYFWLEVDRGSQESAHYFIPWTSVMFVALDSKPSG